MKPIDFKEDNSAAGCLSIDFLNFNVAINMLAAVEEMVLTY
jgi:hypothetical protein